MSPSDRPKSPNLLETERLVLRPWRVEDAPELRAVLDSNDAHLRPWIPFMVDEPRNLEGTRAWLEEIVEAFRSGAARRYRIDRRDVAGLVGEVMLIDRVAGDAIECGYWLDARVEGQGYATEAVERLMIHAFEDLGVSGVEFHCDERNGASNALPPRLGATLEGTIDSDGPLGPAWLNVWRVGRR